MECVAGNPDHACLAEFSRMLSGIDGNCRHVNPRVLDCWEVRVCQSHQVVCTVGDVLCVACVDYGEVLWVLGGDRVHDYFVLEDHAGHGSDAAADPDYWLARGELGKMTLNCA